MTKREIENLIRLRKQQLKLIDKYREEFLKQMSERELYGLMDDILDKLKDAIDELEKFKE